MNSLHVAITFDVDFINYTNEHETYIDEFSIISNYILPFLEKENIKATWFIRIDKKVEKDFGYPDYLFRQHEKIINKLVSLGHKIGWHPHYFTYHNQQWVQNTNENSIIEELQYLLPFAKKYNLEMVRVGWGYQTNKTMKFFDDNNFIIDSSCMARPKYDWDLSFRDWELSNNNIFFPSLQDYRIPGNQHLNILEVPITTVEIPVFSDQQIVSRYINLSFKNTILQKPLENWIKNNNFLIAIIHPYEVFPNNRNHHIISYNFNEFQLNIDVIKENALRNNKKLFFCTLDYFKKECI